MLLHGRTFAYNFNFFLNVTFNDLKPLPIGVSKGPFRPYLSYCTLLIESAEIKSPYSVCPLVWIWWCSNYIGTLAASNISTTALEIYGPIPFPGKRITFLFSDPVVLLELAQKAWRGLKHWTLFNSIMIIID